MQVQRHLLKEKIYFPVFICFLLTVFGLWAIYMGREESFRVLTTRHHPAADFFFRYITHIGDGIFILALSVLFALRKKYFLSIGIIIGYLFSGLISQIIKRLLNLPRPKAFFEAMGESVYEVPGVEVHLSGSFPSGHTASAFALLMFLILAMPGGNGIRIFLLLAACLVGYSRVYLSQHFPVDVCAGAFIGILSGLATYWYLVKRDRMRQGKQNT